VELKLVKFILGVPTGEVGLNRTRVELKHLLSAEPAEPTYEFESNQSGIETHLLRPLRQPLQRLNRTRVELKHGASDEAGNKAVEFESNQSGIETHRHTRFNAALPSRLNRTRVELKLNHGHPLT